ncbi:MAG: signal peptidase II [Rhizobiales bacterium]|nr:signal peptidase II [Hyphomicrobiales bacterium]
MVIAVLDQASKLWLLFVFELGERGLVSVLPGIDLVLTWNRGISYGMFQQETEIGRWFLLGIQVLAILALGYWMLRSTVTLTGVALGLIIGGAIGNLIDRTIYGAVVDFVFLNGEIIGWNFRWYVFNLADAAVVAGVIGLVYDSVFARGAAKAP